MYTERADVVLDAHASLTPFVSSAPPTSQRSNLEKRNRTNLDALT